MPKPIEYIDEDYVEPKDEEVPEFDDCEDGETDEEPDCWWCNSTGEGYGDNLRCPYCFGRGTIKRKY